MGKQLNPQIQSIKLTTVSRIDIRALISFNFLPYPATKVWSYWLAEGYDSEAITSPRFVTDKKGTKYLTQVVISNDPSYHMRTLINIMITNRLSNVSKFRTMLIRFKSVFKESWTLFFNWNDNNNIQNFKMKQWNIVVENNFVCQQK